MKNLLKNQAGYSMVVAILLIFLVSIVGLSLITLNTNSMKLSKHEEVDQAAYYIAEAGISVKTEKIIEFANTAKQITDDLIATCNSLKDESTKPSFCSEESYFNGRFIKDFLDIFKANIDITSPLSSEKSDFNTLKSSANVNITCKQSTNEKDCKIFTNNNHDKLTIMIESTGNIDGKTRIIKREIELAYNTISRELSTNPPPTQNNPNNPEVGEISINNPNSSWNVLPIYQFGNNALPGVNFNSGNWTINGNNPKSLCKGNKCDIHLSTHGSQALTILNENYNYYKSECPKQDKSKLKSDTYSKDTAIYVSSLNNNSINISNQNAQVDIIFCDGEKFTDLSYLKATNPEKVNIYLVSDKHREIKIQQTSIFNNFIYAPDFTITHINSNNNELCTNLFVNSIEKIVGAGVILNNSCSGNIPPKLIPENNNRNDTQIEAPTQKYLTIISTTEV